jgi:hypothetical protein
MDFDTLWVVADRARTRPRLAPEDISFVREVAPDQTDPRMVRWALDGWRA